MTDPDDYATWLAANPHPDLQALVARYGGWHLITAQAWADYDKAREEWETQRRDRLTASYTALKRRPV